MGIWNSKIFDNDLSLDLKSEYRDYIASGFTNEETLEKIIVNYNGDDPEDEDYPIFWISLACIQWDLGRLLENVKTKAIDCIDNPKYLEIWESDLKLLEKRKQVLKETKEKLLSPQPPEKKIQKIPENICPYKINDIIFYKRDNGKYMIFCINKLQTDMGGTYPVCFVLNYSKEILPTIDEIKKLKHTKDITLVSWKGNLYKKLIKENRIGYICNYEIKWNKKKGDGCYLSNWENIEALIERHYNDI
jgi:hypothetical protein